MRENLRERIESISNSNLNLEVKYRERIEIKEFFFWGLWTIMYQNDEPGILYQLGRALPLDSAI